MSLLKEVSGNIVGSTRLGTFSVLNVDEQVFTEERDLVQDLTIDAEVATANLISCIFAFPPGIPVLDSSAPTFFDDVLKFTRYSFPLGTPWTIYFIDTAIHLESDGNYYQYQLRKTEFSNQAGNFYFLGTSAVDDGYWAVSGFDLLYSGAAVPGKVGPAEPGQQLFALVDTVTPPLVQAPVPWLQFYPTLGGSPPTPALDSRRCYYLKFGVPSSTAGTVPITFGAPYASLGLYYEFGLIRKIIDVYGTSGQAKPADVGYYTFEFPGGIGRGFAYVAVSSEGNPLSGDYVEAPARTYLINTDAIPALASINGTYWQYTSSLNPNDRVFNQLISGNLVDRATDALLTVEPSNNAAGFIVNNTGIASPGAFFPSKDLIAFKPEGSADWKLFTSAPAVPGYDV